MSGLDPTLEPSRPVRRVEIINGIGGRRRWSVDDKARIVEETLAPGAVVSEIARRHGLTPQQLFGWRRAARRSVDGRRRCRFAAVRAGGGGAAEAGAGSEAAQAATGEQVPAMRRASSRWRSAASRCGSGAAPRRRPWRR